MSKNNFKELELPYKDFIGGWYIPENICDDVINFFNDKNSLLKDWMTSKLEEGGDIVIEPGLCISKGTVGPGRIDVDTKDSIDMSVSPGSKPYKDFPISNYIDALQNCLENYVSKYPYIDELTHFNIFEPINIQKYKPKGGFKKYHCENTSPITMPRRLVFMTYLNTVPDGGGTEFFHQKLKLKAEKGLTVIWPAEWTHTHRGIISEEFEKYIITGWYNFEVIPGSKFAWL